jgi:6-phosphogluconate dehydrogenase
MIQMLTLEQKNTFLVSTGAQICEQKDKAGFHVLAEDQDKVVQDVTGEEGTGVWSNEESVNKHIPAPALSAAHFLRIVSANRSQRQHVKETFHGSFLPSKIDLKDEKEKKAFIEDLRRAVYAACLASFVQGMCIIDAANRQYRWSIDYSTVAQIWRAGCIISSDHIIDLLASTFKSPNAVEAQNLLYDASIANELKTGFAHLKRVVLKATEANDVIPSISATLEYLKYCGNLELPTQFYEAELDYFGKHMYDKKGEEEEPGLPKKGKHHFEWKPA